MSDMEGNDRIEVEIDGQPRQVTMDELKSSYMLRADMERQRSGLDERSKIADEQRSKAEAFDKIVNGLKNDPQGALRMMAARVGQDIKFAGEVDAAAEPPAPRAAIPDAEPADAEPADPRIEQMQQQINQLNTDAALRREYSEFQQLQAEIEGGDKITFEEVIQRAESNGIDSIADAFKVLAFERNESLRNDTIPIEAREAADMNDATYGGSPFHVDAADLKDPSSWNPRERYPSDQEINEMALKELAESLN